MKCCLQDGFTISDTFLMIHMYIDSLGFAKQNTTTVYILSMLINPFFSFCAFDNLIQNSIILNLTVKRRCLKTKFKFIKRGFSVFTHFYGINICFRSYIVKKKIIRGKINRKIQRQNAHYRCKNFSMATHQCYRTIILRIQCIYKYQLS